MHALHLFVNDLSHPFEKLSRQDKINLILDFVKILRQLRTLTKNDMVVICDTSLPYCTVGQDEHIGSILHGEDYRDAWRLLRSIEDKNHFHEENFHLLSEVRYKGVLSNSMNLAFNFETAVVSFKSADDWSSAVLTVMVSKADVDGTLSDQSMDLKNIARLEHCEHWKLFLTGGIQSPSAEIYRCAEFTIKMYLRDHKPPHVHVFENGNAAVVSLDRYEVMQGAISMRILRQAESLLRFNKDLLTENWTLCRTGRLPQMLTEPEIDRVLL